MSSEALLSNIVPFAGSGLLGYAMGFALKKVLKWMLIILGFLAGMFFVGVQLLQKYGYVSTINWDKLGNDTSMQIQHWVTNVDVTNVKYGEIHTHTMQNLKSIHSCLLKDVDNKIYVANTDSNNVSVIDASTDKEISRILVGENPSAIEVSNVILL
jgi:YVTN family beta-propeller protein